MILILPATLFLLIGTVNVFLALMAPIKPSWQPIFGSLTAYMLAMFCIVICLKYLKTKERERETV